MSDVNFQNSNLYNNIFQNNRVWTRTKKPSIEDIFDDCDDQLFSSINNTNSLHILQQYMPDRPSLNYSLRPRRHNITLITKTSELNHRDFIIRNIYKDLY